jgi:Tol biopolymer transport system component/DNA-binding winged helix-turn-helix (wHTH) protein
MTESRPQRVRFGAYEVDLHTHELWKNGLRIKLVGQPFEILAVLVTRPGELVTREELRTELWPEDTFVDFNHGLNAAVNKLRDALCDSAEDPKYIETLPRRGYRFVGKIDSTAPAIVEARVPPPRTPAESPASGFPAAMEPPTAAPPIRKEEESQKCSFWHRPFFRNVLKAFAISAVVLTATFLVFHSRIPEEVREREAKIRAELAARFQPLTDISDPTKEPAFAPDGVHVAFVRQSDAPEQSGIYVKGVVGDEFTQLTKNSGDCCPAWSPDGGLIAFTRTSENERTLYTVSSGGGAEKKLISLPPGRGEIDWSPDGASIAYTAAANGSSGISLLHLQDLSSQTVTSPNTPEADWGPAFSPDGTLLAFVRGHSGGGPYELIVHDLVKQTSRKLLENEPSIIGSPAWTQDGEALIYSSNRDGSKLWRIGVSSGSPTELDEVGEQVWNPAVARVGNRLAYQKITSPLNIWQIDIGAGRLDPAHVLVSSTTGTNVGAQFSPDGKKLAFTSDRNGSMEVWISNRDGSDPLQVTTVRLAGTPRWSPDGKSIAFDVNWKDRGSIYVLRMDGGVPRAVVQDAYSNVVPSWSRDGRWIYFASNRTGSWQVWKTPLDGGPTVQVTMQGGFAPFLSRDGSTLFYAKNDGPLPEMWNVPVLGGPETRVSPLLKPSSWASWAEGANGIYFIAPGQAGMPTLNLLNFADHRIRTLTTLERFPFWLTLSPDGKSLVFDMSSREESHIMIENNFH